MIATFTDFGPTGPYQGQMAAVIATQAPKIPQVTLMADAPMFDPQSAGLLLSCLCNNLPPHTLVLAVVDPGVGGNRRPIMIKNERNLFIGPDNGLFIPIVRRSDDCEIETIAWRPHRLSETFHGRDLFAPVAAKLATGKEVEGSPLKLQEMVGYDSPLDDNRIIYIDNYGNAITGINAEAIRNDKVFFVNGTALHYARTFSEVPAGQAFWHRNSMGLVEFAVNRGSVARLLNLDLGMPVEL
ncbi:MAG: SAM-dependent chlorinase/fluorinase [Candidatus Thiodiazotropha sp. (ex Epidulcina cf. delphinae)]|nr:SAM-dependent chlorinase/fluorinase [Candidatus Thiodiazotropha sp. (ex Epidulcina cf. delphinae)]